MNKRVIIIGAGGNAKVIADIVRLNNDQIIGYLDDDAAKRATDQIILGKVCDVEKYIASNYLFIVSIGNNQIRKVIMEKYAHLIECRWYSAIHPAAVIAQNVIIGDGSAVMANAVINSGSHIGQGVIINTAATVDHDCIIEDYVHVSPGAHIAGTVTIGSGTWLCIGALISNNIKICENCIIGAGAVVINDIHISGTYIGIPAKLSL